MPFAKKLTKATLFGLTTFALSHSVLADETFTWDFEVGSGDCTENCQSQPGATPTKTFSVNGSAGSVLQVEASAWANTGNGNTEVAAGSVTRWSGGLGVCNAGEMANCSTSPDHSTDNNINYDLVMFDFGTTPVALTGIDMGWYQTDADISVLAYSGAGMTTPDLTGIAYSASTEGFTTGGDWTLVGSYDVDGAATAINAAETFSKYWIVAAYNQQFTACGTCQDATQQWTNGNYYPDYFKIGLLSGKTEPRVPPSGGGVPVPSPLMLTMLGAALLTARNWQRRA